MPSFIILIYFALAILSSLLSFSVPNTNNAVINTTKVLTMKVMIENITNDIKELYKTVWEMKMRTLIDMAADRAAFIDQSQSLNLFMETPSYQKITSMHFYAWRKGLKTGMYYLRTQGASEALKFTVENAVCTRYDNSCESCSG